MDENDLEMLDGTLSGFPSPTGPLDCGSWCASINDELNPPYILSSSPMSLSDEYLQVHALDQAPDGDSTSHLQAPDRDLTLGCATNVQFTLSENAQVLGSPRDQAIAQIELVFEGIADALLADRNELSITLNAQRRPERDIDAGETQRATRSRSATFTFPGKSANEAWRFTVIVRLLEMMHEAVRNGTIITKRDLYYRDPALFGKQSVVDRNVDQIALAFNIPRSCMNITAAAKGLMAGAASLCRRDGSRLDLVTNNEGTLIANMEDILSVDMQAIQWVLVIEKEATFQSIITSDDWQSLLRWQGIIITGKGYPDIATRAMVRFITQATPQNGFAAPPVFGLMDYDPDGLAILSIYKHGSSRLSHENEGLVVPQIQWLGLNTAHITDVDQTHRSQGLMPLTKRDRHKARRMLAQHRMTEDGEEAEWRSQLQVMLMLNVKAELQILDAIPGALGDLVRSAAQ